MSLYPILEFDPAREAIIEPSRAVKYLGAPEHCVVCFFGDVVEKICGAGRATLLAHNHWEDGPHPLYEMDFNSQRLAVCHIGVGSSLAAGILEEIIAQGCRKFVACGGCGVLDKAIAVGHLLVPTSAIRDEGVSYHYLPPGREVSATPTVVTAIEGVLQSRQVPYLLTKTWTTDAPYRETQGKVQQRKAEGCLAVEMEAAAFFAVAQFRGVPSGQMLYGGDDVSGGEWDSRAWQSRADVRENLFWLAAEACLNL